MNRTIEFTSNELSAISVALMQEIWIHEKLLEEDDFSYREDKVACVNYLQALKSALNKINKKGDE